MAGDWIKMRGNLWDDPRVARLCDLTDSGEAAVIGGLYWLWATADQHSSDGVMPGLTLRSIDRKTGIPGLGDALVSIGWLINEPEGVRIVRFEEHNGTSAKKRCVTAKRVANHRSNDDVTQEALQDEHESVTPALAREEKRREEKEKKEEPKNKTPRVPRFDAQAHLVGMGVNDKVAEDWLALRKKKNLAPTATAFEGVLLEAGKAGMTMDQALRTCCTRGWGGFDAGWLDKGGARSGGGGVVPLNRQEALERQNRKIAMEFAQELRHAIV
jgi:hypothetical protein